MTSQVNSTAEQADNAEQADPTTKSQRGPGLAEGQGPGVDKEVRRLDRVIIRFAGDSGDGMQLTGDRFTSET
ncbi:2-oxoglutarate ferredoxin oxidoreductase subunit alpha, partial [Streptomyces sp. HSW2009]